jgi:hypothetical protein
MPLLLARISVLFVLISMVAWPVAAGLRTGRMWVGGRTVTKRANPLSFWGGVIAGAAAIALLVSAFFGCLNVSS